MVPTMTWTDRQTDRETDAPTNAIIIAVRRNTAWDARNVYLNIMYFNILHRMCNLAEKSLTTSYGADCDTDRQTDRRTDGCHNNGVTNHEADAVKRSISLTTLVKQYNLILLVWEGNRGSNPRMNRKRLIQKWTVA